MKKTLLLLCSVLCCTMMKAQDTSQYKTLSDSAFLDNEAYQKGNKYQKDAILYVNMLADTHPYYIHEERREKLFAKQDDLLKACGECTSDSAFTQLLYGVLGKLHDKHTDVIDPASLAQMKQQQKQQQTVLDSRDMGHVMSPRKELFSYQLFSEESICYLQFNQCADARTKGNDKLPRWDLMLDEMFGKMEEEHISTLVVDAQNNGGGSSMLCDELLVRLCPAEKLKTFSTYLRFSDLMGAYNPRIAVAKKAWEEDGHTDELYPMPAAKISDDYVQPKLYNGKVVFVQSERTYSSAGMLMTLARDNKLGSIIGETSTYNPSHYGEVLPFVLPNTGELGSVCTKYFARPDSDTLEDETLEPDVKMNLKDREAVWQYIVDNYGAAKAR